MAMKWKQITPERFDEMLCVLPPAVHLLDGFLLGEPFDHNAQGQPRFTAFLRINGKPYESLGVMTAREFRELHPLRIKPADLMP